MVIAETSRLTLRYVVIDDAHALEKVFGDPEVMRFSEKGARSAAWVRGWLGLCLEHHYPTWGHGPYSLVEKRSGEIIG
ncbi:GNAT family N-acetyltransferase [Truepera radiovictrix]|uniref:GNAT family N-acetyltransferase n=1 Tax=Truepera radiovictrix TaxID=332249 RepID=UPI00030A2BF9|nr:GNAT family N-acetyltransferase [Truepera radiovictrix]WMT58476.1 GNAT family N-acetyltransferase [Truepera radiovictrix]